MADVIGCLMDLVVIVLVGFAFTSILAGRQRRSFFEIAGLTLLLGAGATGTLLILLSIIGLAPSRVVITLLGILSMGGLVALGRAKRLPILAMPRLEPQDWLVLIIPMLLLLGANLTGAIPAISFAYFEWDSAVIWGFKAKVLYEQPLLWHGPEYFHDVRFSYSHLDYPLLWPMLVASVYGAIGHPSEQLGKIILPLIVAGESLLAYSGARLWLGRFASLLLAIMLVGAPFAVIYAAHGSADTPLTAFYLGSVVYLIRWIMHRQRSDILLAAMFTGFVASTKAEGLPLAAIHLAVTGAVILVSRQPRDWKDFRAFAAIVVAFLGFWILWRAGLPHTHDDYASRLKVPIIIGNLNRIGAVLGSWKDAFIGAHSFGWLWMILPILAALGFRAFASREAMVLWALLVLHLLLYMLVYVITDWDVRELLSVTSQRLLLHATPLAMMLLAVHWSAVGRSYGMKNEV